MAMHHRVIGRAMRLWLGITKPRTIGVRAILLDGNDRVALVRHTYTDNWYLPGGGVKKWESAESAIHRELYEEIAISHVIVDRIVGVYHSNRESKDDHIITFSAKLPVGTGHSLEKVDSLEIRSAGWFPLDRLPPTTSPATVRRIAEYCSGRIGLGTW